MDWIVGVLLIFTVYKIHMLMNKLDTTTLIRPESKGKKRTKKE
jgi:hypothetical protein